MYSTLITSKGRLGFTFTHAEVETIRSALRKAAETERGRPTSECTNGMLATKLLTRLCKAGAKGVIR